MYYCAKVIKYSYIIYVINLETTWKGKYWSTDNTKIGKERVNSYWKNEEISRWKAHINTWNLNNNVSTMTYQSWSEQSKCMWTNSKDDATCAFHLKISSFFFGKSFLILFIFLCYSYFGTLVLWYFSFPHGLIEIYVNWERRKAIDTLWIVTCFNARSAE